MALIPVNDALDLQTPVRYRYLKSCILDHKRPILFVTLLYKVLFVDSQSKGGTL